MKRLTAQRYLDPNARRASRRAFRLAGLVLVLGIAGFIYGTATIMAFQPPM